MVGLELNLGNLDEVEGGVDEWGIMADFHSQNMQKISIARWISFKYSLDKSKTDDLLVVNIGDQHDVNKQTLM